MIRLFKLTAAYAAAMLLWVRYKAKPEGMEAIARDLRSIEMSPQHVALFEDVADILAAEIDRGAPLLTLDEVLDPVLQSISAEPPPDVSLIDKLADLTKLPFGLNTLTGSMLKNIRAALLSRADYDALEEKLKKVQLHCSGCGHTFTNGEGAYFAAGGRDQSPQLQCFRCSPPVYSACGSCANGLVAVSNNVRVSLQAKSSCEDCRVKKAQMAREAAQAAAPRPAVLQNLQDIPADMRFNPNQIIEWMDNGIAIDGPPIDLGQHLRPRGGR